MRLSALVLWSVLSGFFCLAMPASALGGTLAMFEFEVRGLELDRGLVERLSDYMGTQAVKGGGKVITPLYFRERAKGMKKCKNYACRIKLARWLGAGEVVISKILKFGDACQLTLELRRADGDASTWATSVKSGCAPEELMKGVESLAEELNASRPKPRLRAVPPPRLDPPPQFDPPPQPVVLTQQAVNMYLKLHQGRLGECSAEQYRREPDLTGRMNMLFDIEPDGQVSKVKLLGRKFLGSYAAECAHKVISSIKFPPFEGQAVKRRTALVVGR